MVEIKVNKTRPLRECLTSLMSSKTQRWSCREGTSEQSGRRLPGRWWQQSMWAPPFGRAAGHNNQYNQYQPSHIPAVTSSSTAENLSSANHSSPPGQELFFNAWYVDVHRGVVFNRKKAGNSVTTPSRGWASDLRRIQEPSPRALGPGLAGLTQLPPRPCPPPQCIRTCPCNLRRTESWSSTRRSVWTA